MAKLIHYTTCPVCNSSDVEKVLEARDHTVSKESFQIMECSSCTLRFTQDAPGKDAMSAYYKSEDYISHTDTSKGWINKVYKQVRQFTLGQKLHLVEKYTGKKKGAMLEIGSGTGAFAARMKNSGWQVTGLEPDKHARDIARDTQHIMLEPVEKLFMLPEASFDAVVMWHVLEHVHDLHEYIDKIRALLKKGGKLFVAVPNYTASDAAVYGPFWAAYDVPRHLYHFSPASMKKLMELHQLSITKYLPMWFDSYYISLLSDKYQHGRSNWLNALINGSRSNLKALNQTDKCSSVIYVIEK